jgi:hypothetical protein
MTSIIEKCPDFFAHIETVQQFDDLEYLRASVLHLDKEIKWLHKQKNDIAKLKYLRFLTFNDWEVNVGPLAVGLYKTVMLSQGKGYMDLNGARFTVTPNIYDITITSCKRNIINESDYNLPLLQYDPIITKIRNNSPLDFQGAPVRTHINAMYIRRREMEEQVLLRMEAARSRCNLEFNALYDIMEPDDDFEDLFEALCTCRDILYEKLAKMV